MASCGCGAWPAAVVGHQHRVRASVTDKYRMLLKLVDDWKELCLAQTGPLKTENLNDAVDRKTSLQSLSKRSSALPTMAARAANGCNEPIVLKKSSLIGA